MRKFKILSQCEPQRYKLIIIKAPVYSAIIVMNVMFILSLFSSNVVCFIYEHIARARLATVVVSWMLLIPRAALLITPRARHQVALPHYLT